LAFGTTLSFWDNTSLIALKQKNGTIINNGVTCEGCGR
jgi:hypothetical protein